VLLRSLLNLGTKLPKNRIKQSFVRNAFHINFVIVSFEEYLLSKKIDSASFKSSESLLWQTWEVEFNQMHPQSFTSQKLYLINPIRLRYPLKVEKVNLEAQEIEKPIVAQASEVSKPAIPKPTVVKPKLPPAPKPNEGGEENASEVKKPAKPVMAKPVLAKPKLTPPASSAGTNSRDEEVEKPISKPAMPKPVLAKPKMVVPKPSVAEDSSKENSALPKEPLPENSGETTPEKKPMARPVFKPRIKPQ
jgi:hypothetical protein